ncbi:MAG: Ig-like domain-containing protein [Thermoplasmata archaeon]
MGSGPAAYVALVKGIENWGDLDTPLEPSAREAPAMAYDSTRDVFVMFGGYDGSFLNDTWEYDYATNTWLEISTTNAPPARELSSMAYDSTNDVFVLFGGYGPSPLDDTWEYDPIAQTWAETTPGFSPRTMYSYHLTFDSSAGRVILAALDFATTTFETWAYDASLDSWVLRSPPTSPTNRNSHIIVYNPSIDKTVLFAGMDIPATFFSDVWEYDYPSDTWVAKSPGPGPSGRFSHVAVYRAWDQSVVIYGGVDAAGGYPIDTWKYEYVGGSETWTEILTILNPGQRSIATMDYSTADNATVIFGGSDGIGLVNDTYQLGSFYISQGIFASSYIDTLHTDTIWEKIFWNATVQPPGTSLDFQLAVSNVSSGSWNFAGPGGIPTSYYTIPGQQIWSGCVGRFLKYSARLISFDGRDTPIMDDVTIVYTIPPLPPRIVETDPESIEFGVEITRNMTVLFSEPMNTATVTWTINPDPGGWTVEWDSVETILYLNHSVPFEENTVHIAEILSGDDKDGNSLVPGPVSNPWAFSTEAIPPYIEETEPADNDVDVALNHPIWINFSEPMDTATVAWTILPDPGGWTEAWQNSDMTLYLTHSADYNQCVQYVVQVTDGKDTKGIDLAIGPAPNPWRFDAICLDPFIQLTDPGEDQIDIPLDYPITVTFSKEVDNTTLVWTIDPDPGGWTPTWGPQNTSLLLSHSNLFAQCTPHTVEIVDIQDLGGGHLIPGLVPNPWSFMTTCPNPSIAATNPTDGQQDIQTDASISVFFSEEVLPATFQWTIDPDPDPLSWTEWWYPLPPSPLYAVQLNHSVPFGQCTDYTVDVAYVEDLSGNPLVPGLAPNPWTFNTTCSMPVIVETIPAHNDVGVALDASITINFSRSMNTTTFVWDIFPNPGGWSESWQNSDRTAVLTHSVNFNEAETYTVSVISIEDVNGNLLISGPVPNPWQFSTISANPFIVLTDPFDGEPDIPVDKTIDITFSESMSTGTVIWQINPDPGGWTETWNSPQDTQLSLSHSNPFAECIAYTLTVTDGEDLVGNPLVAGPVPNPFSFFPICTNPWISATIPVNGTMDVPVDLDITISFSEPMDTATLAWSVLPFVLHQPFWSNGNMTLTLDHGVDYAEGTEYEVTISCDDMDGNPLIPTPIPNPFYFTTVAENPFVVLTDPFDGETGVGVMAPVVITFSEEMDTPTVTWSVSPDPGGWTETWNSPLNTALTLTHSNPFPSGTLHTAEVLTGDDISGYPLIPGPVPNPWTFTTEIPNPYITSTDPADGATGVPLDKSIIINFNEEIDTATFQWTIVPDPGGTWTEDWSNGNMTVTLNHTVPFLMTTMYTVTVTAADDMDGYPLIAGPVPNPWSFTTSADVNPWIVDTYPADGAIDVPLMSCIWINFSEPIDTPTFTWNIVPDPGGWTEMWDPTDTTVTLCHSTPYAENTLYTVTVTAADDMDGNALVVGPVPNPWSFTTGIVDPWITNTSPSDGDVDVPLDAQIIVNFSEPMDIATLFYTVVPDPGGLATSWSNFDMTLTIDHNPFVECTLYTVTILAQDLQGQPLAAGPVPNPWSFTAVCLAPYILVTDPVDAAVGVLLDADIIIQFSEQIDTPTFTWNIVPDPLGWTEAWTMTVETDDTVTLSHATLFDQCQMYTVTVTAADDMDGNPLTAGPVPNPWTFNTICPITPPTGLTVMRLFPATVRLDWNVVASADSYNVYDSGDKFAAFPGGWNVVNTANNFYEFAHLDDGLMHYYIVRAFNLVSGESTNSTMGVKIDKTFSPVQMSIYWMSLPYNSEYATAGDIATELTDTNVNVIAKWDRASQQIISYYYARGKWRGRDFTIAPGDGIYVSAIANFNWYIVGTDSSITIDLPYSPLPFKHNKHYISLPYTGAYALASDIVVDIEGGLGPGTNTYIIEVGLWDAASQSERTYTYTPSGWTGDNFAISPGDGIYLKMVQSYTWSPLLVTPYVP